MIPLSYAQRRLWFIHRFEGPSATYNIVAVFRLHGVLDDAALRAAVTDVVARHESLRTRIGLGPDGEPHQHIVASADAAVDVPVVEVAAAEVPEAVTAAVTHRFELTEELPLRAQILRTAPDSSVLVLVIHHLAADGGSAAPLAQDLMTAYAARREYREPDWAPLPVQYKDYTLWQRELLGDDEDPGSLAAAQVDYWRTELAGVPQPLRLPLDRPRPAESGHSGDAVHFSLPAPMLTGMEKLAGEAGGTVSMVVQAALVALLHRLGGGDDITVGSPIAGRTDEALADMVGLFVNTWVLRADLSGNPSFIELLMQVREKALAAYENQDVPFDRLVERLNPARSTAYHPLFQVMCEWQNVAESTFALPGLEVEFEPVSTRTTKFDLLFTLMPGPGGTVHGSIQYATDLFDRTTVSSLADRFGDVLTQLLADPAAPVGRLDVLRPGEHDRVTRTWNETAHDVPEGTLASAFESQAARTPDRTAVIQDDVRLTYAELNARANQLAHWLVARGAGPETIVGLRMPRSLDLLVAVYGIVKSGAAYLPIDPDLPPERVKHLVSDARPLYVLDELPDLTGLSTGNPAGAAVPDSAAYVIYTSGSSGGPKGVVVSHRSILNRLHWGNHHFSVRDDDRTLLITSVSFDVSVPELFAPLIAGSAVVVAKPDGRRDPAYLARLITEQRVTSADFVPSLLEAFVAEPAAAGCTSLRRVEAAGEALPVDLADRFVRLLPGTGLHNVYGPTEAAVEVTAWEHTPTPNAVGVPIGFPIWNTRVYVLDEALRPVPPGVAGELHLAGTGLARGYLGRPGLTAERFVADPFRPGERMYRTGDLARRRSDGAVEYLGRIDFQIKVRGFRIEPAEIESLFATHDSVTQAVVVAREDRPGDQRLVAYVTVTDAADRAELTADLKDLAQRNLPEYMVPGTITVLDELPVTTSGKIDRRALPAPGAAAAGVYRAPRNRREETLARLFAEVLGVERVGINDDFFDLGGHSLLATRLMVRVQEEMGADVPIRAIFRSPTVADLSGRLLSGSLPDEFADPFALVLPLSSGDGDPVWCLPPGGGLSWSYLGLATEMDQGPLFGIQARGYHPGDTLPTSIEQMVGEYVDHILERQEHGPYRLIGWSYGGALAHAAAAELTRRGHRVSLLALLDCVPASAFAAQEEIPEADARASIEEFVSDFVDVEQHSDFLGTASVVLANNMAVIKRFESPVHVGDVHYFHASLEQDESWASLWKPHVQGVIHEYDVSSTHLDMTMPGPAAEIAAVLNRVLAADIRPTLGGADHGH
ncbi:amino acid adenylation domain-containing protein [Actinoplanes sp. NPDC049599]|uniref:amino acid adenylation domain-containing protein n=1 Tax=Actinoplanes sp. NPDC049599 TaxID=3363903 RepID=UPI0037A14C6C